MVEKQNKNFNLALHNYFVTKYIAIRYNESKLIDYLSMQLIAKYCIK